MGAAGRAPEGATDGVLCGGFRLDMATEAFNAVESAAIATEDGSIGAGTPVMAGGTEANGAEDPLLEEIGRINAGAFAPFNGS